MSSVTHAVSAIKGWQNVMIVSYGRFWTNLYLGQHLAGSAADTPRLVIDTEGLVVQVCPVTSWFVDTKFASVTEAIMHRDFIPHKDTSKTQQTAL